MTDFTPGPWAAGEHRGVWAGPVVKAGNRGVCFVAGNSEANARLIAAAPEMLAALNEAYDALNIAPRFKVRDTDSYAVAFKIGELLNKINVVEGRDE